MKLYLLTLFATLSCWASESVTLEVELKDDRRSTCSVYVAVYRDPRTWLSEKPDRFEKGEMKAGSGTVQVTHLPPGKYAILSYCDQNDNGKLDENWLGVPTEAYGFSNGKPGKLELKFAEAAFELSAKETRTRQPIALRLP
jgi:uncharacterized protein (DUF2141 family)